jgi:hypothetical protein
VGAAETTVVILFCSFEIATRGRRIIARVDTFATFRKVIVIVGEKRVERGKGWVMPVEKTD